MSGTSLLKLNIVVIIEMIFIANYWCFAFILHALIFVLFLFLLVSRVGCGFWLWHSLDFFVNVFGIFEVNWYSRGHRSILKDTRQTNKFHSFFNERNILIKLDEKAMIGNRYNQIPHPSQTPYGKGIKTIKTVKSKTAQAESHEVSSFPVDVHQAILNKTNKWSLTNRKRTDN